MHIGHIKHLNKAKKLGDKLVVTLTSDIYVNKGPGKPVFNQNLRCEALAALDSVDFVAINDSPTAVKPIKMLKPNIYCKGQDYQKTSDDITGEIKNEIKELKRIKGKIFFTNEITYSSSNLINKSTNFFSSDQKKIIRKISKISSFEKIKKEIERLNNLKVLVIGDSLWHDIAGGKKMKLDSLWIKNGIHKSQLKKKDEIKQLLDNYSPKYAISDLKL